MESKVKLLRTPYSPNADSIPSRPAGNRGDIRHRTHVTGNDVLATVAFWNIAAGVIGGLLAAVFGFLDWLGIPAGTRAKQIGLLHGGGNVVVVALFAVSWLLRP